MQFEMNSSSASAPIAKNRGDRQLNVTAGLCTECIRLVNESNRFNLDAMRRKMLSSRRKMADNRFSDMWQVQLFRLYARRVYDFDEFRLTVPQRETSKFLEFSIPANGLAGVPRTAQTACLPIRIDISIFSHRKFSMCSLDGFDRSGGRCVGVHKRLAIFFSQEHTNDRCRTH